MVRDGIKVSTTARSPRLAGALRILRGHRSLNDQQTISGHTSKTRANPGRVGRDAWIPRANGHQPIRAANQSAGYSSTPGASDDGLRLGLPPKELAELTQDRLKQLLHYEPETGIFTWRVERPRGRIGKPAGTIKRDGYVHIGVDYNRYFAHRLAFLYMTGEMPEPKQHVDHINSNTVDNRWANLRLATSSQNQMNVLMWSSNTSGYKGVSWHKGEGRWRACIRVKGKRKYLGYFDTAEQGYAAYCEAAKLHHGEFARLQ